MGFKTLAAGCVTVILLAGVGYGATWLPSLGAGALLHPFRRQVASTPLASCEAVAFSGFEITLAGWNCRHTGVRRGTLVYLHGVADNRTSGSGVIERFTARGFDVIAYDSRAHGDSGGTACTYGYLERRDLRQVLDTVAPGPIVLLGTSLGAAVALQTAAEDPRISAVVAAETFSDLRTVATERAPFFFTPAVIDRAFSLVEERAGFNADLASPVDAATRITAPVLLLHGDADRDTPPDHSRRVFDALRGPKRLMLVPAAGHNQSLNGDVWPAIEAWIDEIVPPRSNVGAVSLREQSRSGHVAPQNRN